MNSSLIITTYNWKEALAMVLASVARQRVLPDEVIVADDGSRSDTREMLEAIAGDFPLPLRHSWQPDEGFRAARSRNRAIAAAGGDYIVLLDGDMLLHREFIADHLHAARPGCFVQGSRVLTSAALSARLLAAGGDAAIPRFARGVRRRRNALHLPWLSDLHLRRSEGNPAPRGIKTCNQGWWRMDLLALNGFDERMQGWGREDDELAARALHAGLHCRQLRFAGLAYHLHHPERHQDGASRNDIYLQETRDTRATHAALGIDRHLRELAGGLPDLRTAGHRESG
jgi:glycosyltransferase involved in cell wall biosynthesis